MGLLSNLRVLSGSDIGDRYRELVKRVVQLEGDIDEIRDLSEARFRRLRKRQRDDREAENGDVGVRSENPAVARVLARRAARSSGMAGGAQGGR